VPGFAVVGRSGLPAEYGYARHAAGAGEQGGEIDLGACDEEDRDEEAETERIELLAVAERITGWEDPLAFAG